jgi:hypothetical protein
LYGLALIRHDAMRFEAQKLRLIEAFAYPHDAAAKRAQAERLRKGSFDDLPAGERFAFNVAFRVSGYFHVLSAIRDAFQGVRFEAQHPEQYPRFIEDESGEIRVDDAGPSTGSDTAATFSRVQPTV